MYKKNKLVFIFILVKFDSCIFIKSSVCYVASITLVETLKSTSVNCCHIKCHSVRFPTPSCTQPYHNVTTRTHSQIDSTACTCVYTLPYMYRCNHQVFSASLKSLNYTKSGYVIWFLSQIAGVLIRLCVELECHVM